MCAFVKNTASTPHTISSGIPSLDDLVSLVEGSVTCIYEDESSFFHNTIIQTFISSCATEKHEYVVLCLESKLLVKFQVQEKTKGESSQNLKIAWRYTALKTRDHVFKWNLLSKLPLPEDVVLRNLEELLETLKSKKGLKVAVFSLFSPLFGEVSSDEVFETLYEIKKYARLNHHFVFLSLPQFLLKEETAVFFDNIVRIWSNLTLPHENPLYVSFLETVKISSPGVLRVNTLESAKYGIVLKAKKIKIEQIDLPPEQIVVSAGCSPTF